MSDLEQEIERQIDALAESFCSTRADNPPLTLRHAMRALARWCYADAAKQVDRARFGEIDTDLRSVKSAIEQRAREISE